MHDSTRTGRKRRSDWCRGMEGKDGKSGKEKGSTPPNRFGNKLMPVICCGRCDKRFLRLSTFQNYFRFFIFKKKLCQKQSTNMQKSSNNVTLTFLFKRSLSVSLVNVKIRVLTCYMTLVCKDNSWIDHRFWQRFYETF